MIMMLTDFYNKIDNYHNVIRQCMYIYFLWFNDEIHNCEQSVTQQIQEITACLHVFPSTIKEATV